MFPKNAIDITGQRFGRVVVLSRFGTNADNKATWLCSCDCGGSFITEGRSLRHGFTKSCGCLASELASKRLRTHGQSHKTAEYTAWCNMKARCNNPNDDFYAHYGGRGINVCPRWAASFEEFFNDMGCKPSTMHSIDRIDNDGNYEPGNCRWATSKQQALNRRKKTKLCQNK